MEFCIITPIGGLEKYASLSRIHLILPQVKYKAYKDFYVERRKAGDTIILDNGSYEGAFMHAAAFAQALQLYRPHIVACPDELLGPPEHTLEMTKVFINTFHGKLDFPCAFMGIPQAKPDHLKDWWYCCKRMMDNQHIKWIGLPRCLYTHFGRSTELRATIADMCAEYRPDILIHALGMADGSLYELEALRQTGCVSSCDSSAPVWRGHYDYTLRENDSAWEELSAHVDFGTKKLNHHKRILSNLELVGVNVNDRRTASATV